MSQSQSISLKVKMMGDLERQILGIQRDWAALVHRSGSFAPGVRLHFVDEQMECRNAVVINARWWLVEEDGTFMSAIPAGVAHVAERCLR